MIKVILIYIFIAIISFISGLNIWLNHNKVNGKKTISSEILSAEEKYCEGEICHPPEGYDDRTTHY